MRGTDLLIAAAALALLAVAAPALGEPVDEVCADDCRLWRDVDDVQTVDHVADAVLGDDLLYVVGETRTYGSDYAVVVEARDPATGQRQWQRTLDRTGDQRPSEAVAVPGGVALVAEANRSAYLTGENPQVVTAVVDPDGALRWWTSFATTNATESEPALAFDQFKDRVLVAGVDDRDRLTVHAHDVRDGNPPPFSDFPYVNGGGSSPRVGDVAPVPGSDRVAVGWDVDLPNVGRDIVVVGLERDDGGQLWVETYDGGAKDRDEIAGLNVAGGLVVATGTSTGFREEVDLENWRSLLYPRDKPSRDYATLAIDPFDGDRRWTDRHGDDVLAEHAEDVAVGPQGRRVAVTGDDGTVLYAARTGDDLWIDEADRPGETLAWDRTGRHVYVLDTTGHPDPDIRVRGLDAVTGSRLWSVREDPGIWDVGKAVRTDDGRVLVAGTTYREGTNDDLFAAAYRPRLEDQADAGPAEDCPGTGVQARIGRTERTVCADAETNPQDCGRLGVAVVADGTRALACYEEDDDTEPEFGDPATRPVGCRSGSGGGVMVLGDGKAVCVDGMPSVECEGCFDPEVNTEPCPGGTDPEVDAGAVYVQVCPGRLMDSEVDVRPDRVDVDSGGAHIEDHDDDTGMQVPPPDVDDDCEEDATDPTVGWLGQQVKVCVES